ncbi:MAG: molybdate ABC transporter substrate-binding protein [Desulfobulbaceae bacterium A2]|nr:MAG: molybdate ABC transporter substrate-binding protein [Desulfobulbaceae bacterium A2]
MQKNSRRQFIEPHEFLLIMLLALLFCQFLLGSARAGESITVSAGATMTEAMRELAATFEKQHGVQVACNFGASGQLLQQIAQGAPVDVFASADQATMDKAQAQNLLLAETRHDFARNRLVLITPAGSRPLTALKDLARLERIAVGNPEFVPIGRYTRKALEPDGLWQELSPRFVMGVSVRQVLDYVARGEADAGFVFATDAQVAGAKVQSQTDILPPLPISYPAAVLRQSRQPGPAKAFVALLVSAEGQAVLAHHGFIPLE